MPQVIIGQRYGRLVVVSVDSFKDPSRIKRFICKCDCGNEKSVRSTHLRNGVIKSCCCLQRENTKVAALKHGHARDGQNTNCYKRWRGMWQRCTYPGAVGWKIYGGKGIRVCDRWRDYSNFLADMGEPAPGMTLDRIDSNGNYEPSNCRWATSAEQNRNYSRNVNLTYGGETMCVEDWSKRTGLQRQVISARLKRGWSVEKTLATPLRAMK